MGPWRRGQEETGERKSDGEPVVEGSAAGRRKGLTIQTTLTKVLLLPFADHYPVWF